MKHKIGVAVITCDRPEFYKDCINSIPAVDTLITINDGGMYDEGLYPSTVKEVIQHHQNKSIGTSKNEALRYLIQDGCDSLFLVEDDMIFKNPKVFEAYIKTAEETGIWHLNFGYHGPANKTQDGKPNPRQIVEYENGIELALNPNCVGSVSYYHRGVIKAVGYMDERFKNAFEHVEHTYKIIKAGLHPPFWWFADMANSHEYIAEQEGGIAHSIMRKDNNAFIRSVQEGAGVFRHIHGMVPTDVPDTPPEKVLEQLETITKNYKRKVL